MRAVLNKAERRFGRVLTDLLVLLLIVMIGAFGYIGGTRQPVQAVKEDAQETQVTAETLCDVLVKLVQRSSDSIRQHPYYKRNPKELPYALRENRRALRDLTAACPVRAP